MVETISLEMDKCKSKNEASVSEVLVFIELKSCRVYLTYHFRKIKTEQEKVKLNFKSQSNEIYNKDFNLDELVEAIQQSHDSATGPDEIHYQMLKHLPENSLETLLNISNYLWTTGKSPKNWTYATIIPISNFQTWDRPCGT